jgi:MFS family permease
MPPSALVVPRPPAGMVRLDLQFWARATALISAMWGVGTLAGPAIGGLFARLGSWRFAFVVLVAATNSSPDGKAAAQPDADGMPTPVRERTSISFCRGTSAGRLLRIVPT